MQMIKNLSRAIPTVRVKAPTKDGFALINITDFDHDEHELYDKKDAHLVPTKEHKAEVAGLDGLRKQLGVTQDRAIEAESERDEWKARAEAAEAKLGGEKPKAK
jgi:hypothetical protein